MSSDPVFQGMHELLAPIIFVLHCDHQAFLHASESAQPRQVVACNYFQTEVTLVLYSVNNLLYFMRLISAKF